MNTSPSSRILPIQYLRAVAAMMVVWHHGAGQVPGVGQVFTAQFGTSGVDLFFVISGFIMVMTTSGRAITPQEFFVRRLIRVAPIYWILTTLLVVLALAAPSLFRTTVLTWDSVLQSLLFIPHLSPSHAGRVWPVLVPGWTLNYEMFFYAIFAVSLAFSSRLAVVGGTLVTLVLVGFVLGPFDNPIAQTYTHAILLEFAAGALICHLWMNGRLRLGLVSSVVAIVVGAALLVQRRTEFLEGNFTTLAGAVLVVMGSLHERFMGWHSRLLLTLGDASYSIYLTHIFTLGALRGPWIKVVPLSNTLVSATAFMVVALVASALVGWLAFRCIEKPLLDRLNAAWRGRRARVQASG